MSDDMVEKPSVVNTEKKNKYISAIERCITLAEQGKITFECHNPDVDYDIHYLYITWLDHDDMIAVETETSEMREIIDNMDYILIPTDEPWLWQLSSKIYYSITEITK